jgi:hypothetical protein
MTKQAFLSGLRITGIVLALTVLVAVLVAFIGFGIFASWIISSWLVDDIFHIAPSALNFCLKAFLYIPIASIFWGFLSSSSSSSDKE